MSEIENEGEVSVEQESSAPAPVTESTESESVSTEAKPKTEEAPFHEHPRFKELVEERNQWKTKSSEYERRMADLDRRLQDLSKPKTIDPAQAERQELMTRLKGIDPAFAKLMEDLSDKASRVDQVNQTVQEREAEYVRNTAMTQINAMHAENKVPKEFQDLIQNQIELAAMRDPRIGLHNLKEVYQKVHQSFNGVIEGVKRSERESYQKAKTTDSNAPVTQSKGSPAKPGSKPFEYSKNREEAKAQVTKQILEDLRRSRGANSV